MKARIYPNPISITPPVIAHRGASDRAPENTLAAFLKAHELGARWAEFDVMLSACGEVVVFHDETLTRTTNGIGRVDEYPYSYLQTLDAGSWFNPSFSQQRIPTLAEVIDFLCQQQMAANIEIKPVMGNEQLTVQKVLAVIQRCWRDPSLPLLISSFSLPTLEYVRQFAPKALIGLLTGAWFPQWQSVCDALSCVSVHVNEKTLDSSKVAEIKATGRLVLSYTVDEPQRAEQLFAWGVDAVFSNCFDKIAAILPEAKMLKK
jgi:glycerophosphoryl diester phosphodiesterase